jgi:multidrug efflux pump subunit AcrA (membrane-fusion protein)
MRFLVCLVALLLAGRALAQAPSGPPAVGVVTVDQAAITETSEFVGRVQAIQRVALTARVTAFLEQRLFVEGTEVHAATYFTNWNAARSRRTSRTRKPPSPTTARNC